MQFNHSKGFNELMDQLESNIEFLNKLNLDNNVVEFGDIVDSLEQNCDSYVSDETLLELLKMGEGDWREDGDIDENTLRELVKRDFLLIKGDK